LPRPPCGGLATLAGSCGAPCEAPPALASRPGTLRRRCNRRTTPPPLRKGRPSLRRIRLPLRGARPPCGGTAVRSSRPLRAGQMIARAGRDPQGGLSTRFGTGGRVIHDPSTVAVTGPCPEEGPGGGPVPRDEGRRRAGRGCPGVSRFGARSRRSGRPRRPCGGPGRGLSGSRSCRSRGADRRRGGAAGAAHPRLARRERGARRDAAPGSVWTSCPVRTFPGRPAGRCGLGPCDGWSPGEC